MQLKDYIGEATAYDKKLMLERKDPTSWLKSVSAFANTQGGTLLFADAKTSSAKSGAKRGVESSAKSGAKSSAIRRGKAAGKNENIIFRAIRDNSHVSIAELQRKARLSNGGVRKIISVLKSKCKIVRVGGTHGGHWEVVKRGGTVGRDDPIAP